MVALTGPFGPERGGGQRAGSCVDEPALVFGVRGGLSGGNEAGTDPDAVGSRADGGGGVGAIGDAAGGEEQSAGVAVSGQAEEIVQRGGGAVVSARFRALDDQARDSKFHRGLGEFESG